MKIGMIGCGNMGAAILNGIYKAHTVCVCEKDKKRAAVLKRKYRVRICDIACLAKTCDVIVLAVKPQGMEAVVKQLAASVRAKTLVVSIAAGITTRFLEKHLPAKTRVVRTMPNMPAQIGRGLTGISKGRNATAKDVALVRKIFNAVGKTMILEEKMMDAFTAVAGSGPAYMFYFAECMTEAAASVGFSEEQAADIISATLPSSAIQLVEMKDSPANLRKKVTSKGGTTEAGMKVFRNARTGKIIEKVVKAAKKRSTELAR